jgi:hypothetical protein
MAHVIWQGTADVDGYDHPMRVIENANGELMTEWASNTEDDDGRRLFDDSKWYADYQMRFRDMEPTPSPELVARMTAAKLLL